MMITLLALLSLSFNARTDRYFSRSVDLLGLFHRQLDLVNIHLFHDASNFTAKDVSIYRPMNYLHLDL